MEDARLGNIKKCWDLPRCSLEFSRLVSYVWWPDVACGCFVEEWISPVEKKDPSCCSLEFLRLVSYGNRVEVASVVLKSTWSGKSSNLGGGLEDGEGMQTDEGWSDSVLELTGCIWELIGAGCLAGLPGVHH